MVYVNIVSLQNRDAQLFNQFLPELKVTLISKARSNFWQEIIDGNNNNICLIESSQNARQPQTRPTSATHDRYT